MSDAHPHEFREVLAGLAGEVAAGEENIPAIGMAIRSIRERLPLADGVEEAYALLGELVDAVASDYPGGSCRAGCSGCCDSQTAVFDVSPPEWAVIDEHVATHWDAARRARFEARFATEHGPRLRDYRLLAWVRYFEPLADRYFARKPYRCPFLEDGRCAIYAARPLACRMYGYLAIRARWYAPATLYGCSLQVAHFGKQPTLTLPSVNMVVGQSKRLMRGRAKILPQWIARGFSSQPTR